MSNATATPGRPTTKGSKTSNDKSNDAKPARKGVVSPAVLQRQKAAIRNVMRRYPNTLKALAK